MEIDFRIPCKAFLRGTLIKDLVEFGQKIDNVLINIYFNLTSSLIYFNYFTICFNQIHQTYRYVVKNKVLLIKLGINPFQKYLIL